MIKLFILAAASVAVFSINNIANANDTKTGIDYQKQNQSNSTSQNLAVSTSKAVPESDLKSIRQAIANYYKKHNEREEINSARVEIFYEIKKINLIKFEITSIDSKSAILEAFQIVRVYDKYNIKGQGLVRKVNGQEEFKREDLRRMVITMGVDRINKKWEVYNTAFNEKWKPE